MGSQVYKTPWNLNPLVVFSFLFFLPYPKNVAILSWDTAKIQKMQVIQISSKQSYTNCFSFQRSFSTRHHLHPKIKPKQKKLIPPIKKLIKYQNEQRKLDYQNNEREGKPLHSHHLLLLRYSPQTWTYQILPPLHHCLPQPISNEAPILNKLLKL